MIYQGYFIYFKVYFMCIGVKVSDLLEQELQTVVNCHVGARN